MKKIREQILTNFNIVDVIGKYLDLEKSGQNYKCLCPFHDDTNPSFTVSEEKQIFKCFVCNEAGNVIDFVMKYEKVSYDETIKKLGKALGIEVKEKKQNDYLKLLNNINIFYEKILKNSTLGEEALEYLKNDRFLGVKEIEEFGLGYSPEYSKALYEYIINYAKDNAISALKIDELNIFSDKNYDILNGRVTFPIHNENGELVGFSGRTLNGNIKYINSKNNLLFDKQKILYNFNRASRHSNEEILIVEGFFDVISAHKNGIINVAATMGVAFTDYHIKLLKKHKIKNVVLGFDNDSAGKITTHKTAEKLIKNNFNVKVITYNNYKDIDEYLQMTDIVGDFLKNHAIDYILFKIEPYRDKELEINDKSELISKICNLLSYYGEDVRRTLLIEEVAEVLKINSSIIINQLETTVSLENISVPSYSNDYFFDEQNAHSDIEQKNDKIETMLFADKEKVLIYIISHNYDKFLELERIIEIGSFKFNQYKVSYEKLKKIYANSPEIDHVMFLDEVDYYYEINKEIDDRYGKLKLDNICLDNYINGQKTKKISKYKKLEQLNQRK